MRAIQWALFVGMFVIVTSCRETEADVAAKANADGDGDTDAPTSDTDGGNTDEESDSDSEEMTTQGNEETDSDEGKGQDSDTESDESSGTSGESDSETTDGPDEDTEDDSEDTRDSATAAPDSETGSKPDGTDWETGSGSQSSDINDTGVGIESDSVFDTEEVPTDTSVDNPRSGKKKALVSVIDDSLSLGNSGMDELYNLFPDEISSALAKLYDQPVSEIQSRTLAEIAEDFGEDWIIEDVEAIAGESYHAYATLTDQQATFEQFIAIASEYSNQGFLVDVLFNLHGTSDRELIFYDAYHPIEYITSEIESNSINLGVLYQTACYSEAMLDDWVAIGIQAVNGTAGENIYINFAPGAFLENWLAGMGFEEAVHQARLDDIDELRTRLEAEASNNAQFALFLSLYDFEGQSDQIVQGAYPQIGW